MRLSICAIIPRLKYGIASLIPLVVGLANASATAPPDYYQDASGKTGAVLKSALHNIIDDHESLPYSSSSFDTHDALLVLDQDPTLSNNVVLIYSGRSESKATWPAWNREHLWPNSLGIDDDAPAHSDLHNLRACDANVNSSRGNEYYDWSDTNSASYAFPAHVEVPQCSSDQDSWQPPATVRGDIARAQFYMAVRYEGDASNEPDLELTNDTVAIQSTNNLMGRLNTLLQWHFADPVDAAEELRNDRVDSLYQGNRNPFVDESAFVEALFIPRLRIEKAPGGIGLQWENTGAALFVETSSGLGAEWTLVTNTPSLNLQEWSFDLPVQDGFRLYRLRLDESEE